MLRRKKIRYASADECGTDLWLDTDKRGHSYALRARRQRKAISSGKIYPNFPVRGKPFGAMRPAEARAPNHSASSSRLRV
jgi:hypothetical protein